jgi:hypothetical protein
VSRKATKRNARKRVRCAQMHAVLRHRARLRERLDAFRAKHGRDPHGNIEVLKMYYPQEALPHIEWDKYPLMAMVARA